MCLLSADWMTNSVETNQTAKKQFDRVYTICTNTSVQIFWVHKIICIDINKANLNHVVLTL